MNSDQILVLGLILGIFAIPAIISAFSEGRPPRVAAITLIAAACLVIWAITLKPGGYTFEDVPNAFIRVVADIIH